MNELDAIATEPTCVNRFLLRDFDEVESLKYAIEKSTCEGTSRVTSRVTSRYVIGVHVPVLMTFGCQHAFSANLCKTHFEFNFFLAPIIINPGTNGTDTEGKVPADGDQNCKIRVGADGVTVKVRKTSRSGENSRLHYR